MAFSSLYGYLQDPFHPNQRRSDAALKRYDSAKDARAWALDKTEKSNFIHQIVKRKSDYVEVPVRKEVVLDQNHKLFKPTSKKLEDKNNVDYQNREVEAQLRDPETKLKKLEEEQQRKDEIVNCSSVKVETEQASSEIENRAEFLEEIVKERNKLKTTLCKIMSVSSVLEKLRTRADEADEMEVEINKLKRDLQRCGCGYGIAGKKRPETACKQCNKFADELSRSESVLDNEIKKSTEIEAERNFLREQIRALEVKDAELILYKTKYEEAECKLLKAKEMLVKAECRERQVQDLQRKLEESDCQVKNANRSIEELNTTIERQNLCLKEREAYIDSLNHRTQQGSLENSCKKGVLPGKVQSIAQKFNCEPAKSNCKCGFEGCQCGTLLDKRSNMTKPPILEQSSVDSYISTEKRIEVKNLAVTSIDSFSQKSLDLNEATRLQEEISSDEIRLLRQQNAELDQQLKCYKREIEKMTTLMNQVDQQRESNNSLENEVKELNSNQEKEMTSLRTSVCEKDDKLCEVEKKLSKASAEIAKLENKLAAHCKEIKTLRPLLGLQSKCKSLEEKLSCARSKEIKRSKTLQSLQENCVKFGEEKSQLLKQIDDLKKNITEQQNYQKSLASQLENRQKQKDKCQKPKAPSENKEILKKYVCDLKKHYEDLKQKKLDMAQSYEDKLKTLQDENDALRNSSSSNGCNDVLLRKLARSGFSSLEHDELVDVHNRVRIAMMRKLRSIHSGIDRSSHDYYSNMVEELRLNHNVTNDVPSVAFDIPVKDIETCSSRTLPSILRNIPNISVMSDKRLRTRSSSEIQLKGTFGSSRKKC